MTRDRPFWYLRRRRDAVRTEIDDELRLHLDMRIERLRAQGLSEGEARDAALRQFGDLHATRLYCARQAERKDRRMQRQFIVMDLFQDLRFSARSLLHAPLIAITVIATVGLGIGVTTAMFGVVDTALLRPLPYKDPDRLVRLFTDAPPHRYRFSLADYQALDAQQTTFEHVAGYADRAMAFTDGTVAERVPAKVVTWAYFDVLGIAPILGRSFNESDSRPGSPPAVIVSHEFWRQYLGARPDAIGRPLRLDGADHILAGVLPEPMGPLERGHDLFIAARWDVPRRKGPFLITAIGRLREGVSREVATAELHQINRRIFPIWKASYQDDRATWGAMELREHVAGNFRAIARLSFAAVFFVWLIACVNASNLLVARVTTRRRELAVRAALGASRFRVIRYLLAEAAILAAIAAAVGTAIAATGLQLVRTLAVAYVPRAQELALGGRTLLVLLGVTAASAVLFGAVPAIHGTGGPVDEGLRSVGRSSTGTRRVSRLRSALVVSQFAIATPLLVVAGLLVASLDHLRQVDIGFDTRNVLTASIELPAAQYGDIARVVVFWNELQRRLAALPGVTSIAFTDSRPPDDAGDQNNFDLESAPTQAGHSQPVTTWVTVTPDYFSLLRLRATEGRLLDERDTSTDSRPVIVVDEAWSRRFFAGTSAVGKRLRDGGCSTCEWTTIVGVVSDVKYDGLAAADQGTVYAPMATRGPDFAGASSARSRFLVLRTSTDSASIVPSVRDVLRTIDPTLPLSNVATIDELVARSLQQPRGLSLIVTVLGAIGLMLSALGIYGVMAHYIQQHAKDITIRIALGGRPRQVLWLVVRRGMTLVAIGIVAGLAAALNVSRLIPAFLFGIGGSDPITFAGVAAVMGGVALVACIVPAFRAVGRAPAVVLRSE